MQKFWSFLRGRIILIIMKREAICRALLNFSWKVLEAPSLWVTKILSYRKNYILPFGKKKKEFMRYFSYIICKSQVCHGSTCHSATFWCTLPPWTARRIFAMKNVCKIVVRISSMEEYLIPFLKYVIGTSAVSVSFW